MPTTCQINFENNPHRIVFSGQKLYITVRLKLTEEIKVRGIYIHLRGKAHVRFVLDDHGREGNNVADEDLLDMKKCLTDENVEIQVLPVGTHDYTFSCTLPRELPSSFCGSYGWIKYTANVVLRIPFWPDKKYKQKFTVFKPINLNDIPSLRDEVFNRKTQWNYLHGNAGFMETALCVISARIPFGGYTYGQSIDIQVSVNNISNKHPIKCFSVYILRETVYQKVGTEYKKTEEIIVKKWTMNDWFCGSPEIKVFPTASIKVPAMIPPYDTLTSRIIKNKYFLLIEGGRGENQLFVSVALPITIGTIPFRDSTCADASAVAIFRTDNIPSAPPIALQDDIWLPEPSAPYPDDDTVSIRTYTSTPPPYNDYDFDLPTYEESLLMDQEIDISMQSIQETFTQLCIQSTRN